MEKQKLTGKEDEPRDKRKIIIAVVVIVMMVGLVVAFALFVRKKKSGGTGQPQSDGHLMRTDICHYPTDPDVTAARECKTCVCYNCQPRKSASKYYDKQLNLSNAQIKKSHVVNLPWGLPVGGAGIEGCILTQKDYVTGYSTYLHVPLWAANRLDGKKASQHLPRRKCFRRDVRLTDFEASNCSNYYRSSFDRGNMVPSEDLDYSYNASLTTYVLSNTAPQYKKFSRVIWFDLEKLVRQWSVDFTTVYVISGSIFDANGDGMRDKDTDEKSWLKNKTGSVAIPTHYYKIITRCLADLKPYHKVRGCKGRLDVMSFVLPHSHEICETKADECFRGYLTKVKDIERLTGINFFGDLPAAEQGRIKKILPTKLWSSAGVDSLHANSTTD